MARLFAASILLFSCAQARATSDVQPPTVQWQWPLQGRLTSGFGPRDGRLHAGVDIATRPGRTVRAAGEGLVRFSGRNADYGLMVEIWHPDGRRTRYAHLAALWVRKGAWVDAGDALGPVGTTGRVTGPHLHFELREGERPVDPMPLAIAFHEPDGASATPRPTVAIEPVLPSPPLLRATARLRSALRVVLRWFV